MLPRTPSLSAPVAHPLYLFALRLIFFVGRARERERDWLASYSPCSHSHLPFLQLGNGLMCFHCLSTCLFVHLSPSLCNGVSVCWFFACLSVCPSIVTMTANVTSGLTHKLVWHYTKIIFVAGPHLVRKTEQKSCTALLLKTIAIRCFKPQ